MIRPRKTRLPEPTPSASPSGVPPRGQGYDEDENLAHMEVIAGLLIRNQTEARIVRHMRKEYDPHYARGRVIRLIKRVHGEWEVADPEEQRRERRQQLVRSIEETIASLHVRLEATAGDAKRKIPADPAMAMLVLREIRMTRDQLGRVCGLESPQQLQVSVEHQIGGVLAQAIASLSGEEMSATLALAMEEHRMAEEYRQLKAVSIDTVGEAAE